MRIGLLANSNTWLTPFYDAFAHDCDVWWAAYEHDVYKTLISKYQNVIFVPHEKKVTSAAGNVYGYSHTGLTETRLDELVQPDIWITDDATRLAIMRKKTCMWVYAFHSFCYKRYVFHNSALKYDLLLLPSEYFKAGFHRKIGFLPDDPRLAVTGFPKLDPVLSGRYSRSEVLSSYGICPTKKVVLYAPTWGGSSEVGSWGNELWCRWPKEIALKILERFLVEINRCGATTIIKLHSLAALQDREAIRGICVSNGAVMVDDSPALMADPLPLVAASDVLVSDMSGIITEFIAADKPVICIAPESEAAWHEASIPAELLPSEPVNHLDDLLLGIRQALELGDKFEANRRRNVRATLFKYTDGNSAVRARDAIFDRYYNISKTF